MQQESIKFDDGTAKENIAHYLKQDSEISAKMLTQILMIVRKHNEAGLSDYLAIKEVSKVFPA